MFEKSFFVLSRARCRRASMWCNPCSRSSRRPSKTCLRKVKKVLPNYIHKSWRLTWAQALELEVPLNSCCLTVTPLRLRVSGTQQNKVTTKGPRFESLPGTKWRKWAARGVLFSPQRKLFNRFRNLGWASDAEVSSPERATNWKIVGTSTDTRCFKFYCDELKLGGPYY